MTPFQRFVRFWAELLLPRSVFTGIQFVRARNTHVEWLRSSGCAAATLHFIDTYGTSVMAGPFAGMLYPRESILARKGIPFLLGAYELELHDIVNSWQHDGYQAVINVGSAEGYYAVGLARLLGIPVYAFDPEYRERRYCREMAAINGVLPLIRLANWCSPSTLRRLAQRRRVLVVCDCEGFEVELFTADAVEALRHSNILVELHAVDGIDVTSLLCDRFAHSHEFSVIPYTGECDPRHELARLGLEGQRFGREDRGSGPRQAWLWAVSKAAVDDRSATH